MKLQAPSPTLKCSRRVLSCGLLTFMPWNRDKALRGLKPLSDRIVVKIGISPIPAQDATRLTDENLKENTSLGLLCMHFSCLLYQVIIRNYILSDD